MRNLRILIVTPPVGFIGSGEAGGVETHLLHLAPVLAVRGHQVGVVAPFGSAIPGATVYPVEGTPSASAVRASRQAVTEMHTGGLLENMWEKAFCLQGDYDAVIGVCYDWLAFYLTPCFRTPLGHWLSICSTIDEVDSMIARRWRAGAMKLALYTKAQAATFPFLTGGHFDLLYGGVDTGVFAFNPEPANRLCWAARISPEKGLEDAIAAARALRMPLDICGKIQDEAYWRALVRHAGTEVVYHGFLGPAELARRFGNARVTLATPHWIEAFGNTIVESMACGTPVVVYDGGGPAEIIEHGKNGILVPREAGVAGLIAGVGAAAALDRRAVCARAAEYTFDRMADRFEAWVHSVAACADRQG